MGAHIKKTIIILILILLTTIYIESLPEVDGEETPKTGKCGDNLMYEYEPSGQSKKLSIHRTDPDIDHGYMDNYEYNDDPDVHRPPWYYWPVEEVELEGVNSIGTCAFTNIQDIRKVTVLDNELTSIGDYAFDGCINLHDIMLPDTLSSIGDYTFAACVNLETLDCQLSHVEYVGHHAFFNCAKLTKVKIESNLTDIRSHAFDGCTKLEEVTIPNTVTTIGDYAFASCTSLTSNIPYSSGLTSIGDHAFYNCTKLTGANMSTTHVKSIGDHAFANCKGLSNVLFYSNLTDICGHAFHGCTKLEEVTIPDTVTFIGDYAFANCTKLTGADLSNSNVKSIGNYAFFKCTSLTTVSFSSELSSIGDHAFDSCTILDNIGSSIPSTVNYIGDYAFANCTKLTGADLSNSNVTSIADYVFFKCASLTDVSFSLKLTSIGNHAFDGCANLNNIIGGIPSTVNYIGDYAFANCTKLTGADLSNSNVTSIADYVFFKCTSLTTVSFSSELSSIGDHAFEGCKLLKHIILKQQNQIKTIGDYAFFRCEKIQTFETDNSSNTTLELSADTGDYSFADCDAIKTLIILSSKLGKSAFQDCDNLISINISGNLTNIDDSTFRDCSKLNYIDFGDKLETIGDYAFSGSISTDNTTLNMPDSIKSIGDNAFAYCTKLTEVSFGSGLTDIGDNAFMGCTLLESIAFAESGHIKSINKFAFNQTGIKSLTLKNIESIKEFAFYECPQLTDVAIESNIEQIGIGAFLDCPELIRIDVSEEINKRYFSIEGVLIDRADMAILLYPPSKPGNTYTIPEGIEIIEDNSFANNRFLEKVVIGDNVTFIGKSAFSNCKTLIEVEIGDGIENISESSFSDNHALEKVLLGKNTWEIGNAAFSNCDNMTEITFGEKISHIGINAFKGCKSLKNIDLHFALEIIDIQAFADCTGIESIIISPTLSILGSKAFEGTTFYDKDGETELERNLENLRGSSFKKIGEKLILQSQGGYCIRLDPNGGTCETKVVGTNVEGMVESDFPIASQTGRDFIGWFTFPIGGELVDKEYRFMYNTTIYAHFETASFHTVKYDLNGGTGTIPPQNVIKGESFTIKDYDGTKSGFFFSGWMYNDSKFEPGTTMVMGDHEITFVAIWVSKKTHHVVYELNGGSGDAPQQEDVHEGLSFTVADYNGSKEKYKFAGWTFSGIIYRPGDEITMGSTDIKLTAIWNPKTVHKVTYDLDGGSGIAPIQTDVQEDESFIVKNYEGTKAGTHFSGWIYKQNVYQPGDAVVMGGSDIELTAFWVAGEVHHVKYDLNGGVGETPLQPDVTEGSAFAVASCSATKSGLVFKGWMYEGAIYQPGDLIIMIKSDILLTAVWTEVISHQVIYDPDGGSSAAPIQTDVAEGSFFNVKGYYGFKEGYNFKGWYYNGNIYHTGDAIQMGKVDIVLTAIWDPQESTGFNLTQTISIAVISFLSILSCCLAYHVIRK